MHPLTFGFKRVYLRTMYWLRDWTGEFDLTPARFDMMVAIDHDPVGIAQVDLRRTLGVASSVISRMLASLERLGFAFRRPHPDDRRQRWVELTGAGRALVRDARQACLESFVVERFVRSVVSPDDRDRGLTKKSLAAARAMFARLREKLLDGASLQYPSYRPSGHWERPPRTGARRALPTSQDRAATLAWAPDVPPNGSSALPASTESSGSLVSRDSSASSVSTDTSAPPNPRDPSSPVTEKRSGRSPGG